jgi:hypothetical protein
MFGVPAIMPDALHRPDVDVSDAPRDDSVAPEQRKRIVVQNPLTGLRAWGVALSLNCKQRRNAEQYRALE